MMIYIKDLSLCYRMQADHASGLKEYLVSVLSGKMVYKEFWALRDLSFDVQKGEVVGIIGHNGAGKSTLLKIISGILKPTTGVVLVEGNVVPMLELGSGFDFELTGRENIYLNGAILGYSESYLNEKFDEIVNFSELADFIHVPLRNYSSGMVMRLAFSIASVVKPDILIADEILAVGDTDFKIKSQNRMMELMSGGTTVLLVSHDIGQIRNICDRVLWIEQGKKIMYDAAGVVCDAFTKQHSAGIQVLSHEASRKSIISIEPAFTECNVPVVFSSNNDYALYLGVCIESLIQNASSQSNYDIVILNVDISDDNKRLLNDLAAGHPNVSIRFFNMKDILTGIDTSLFYQDNYVPMETYFKFWLIDIFPSYQKILYIDSDVIFLGDVAELFAFDLGDSILAASKNVMQIYGYHCLPQNVLPNGWSRKAYFDIFLKLNHPDDYFQAGSILFNISKCKEIGYREKCLKKLEELRTPAFKDQCVLNSLFNEDVRFFSVAWNLVTYLGDFRQFEGKISGELYEECMQACENPKIVHYAGAEKPQNSRSIYMAECFWKYAESCPFYSDIMAKQEIS